MTVEDEKKSPWRYIPNVLSALRIALIPVIILLYVGGWPLSALSTFVVGAVTDFLDGQLARRFHWHSHVGALLDPVADKLFVLCLIPLLWHQGTIMQWFATLVIVRYSAQLSVFPVLMGWLKRPFKVAPKFVPKLATALAFTVLGLGFVLPLSSEWLPDMPQLALVLRSTLNAFALLGCVLELWVLATFLPRYWLIARGKEDTFV